jgi:hypothetical protein
MSNGEFLPNSTVYRVVILDIAVALVIRRIQPVYYIGHSAILGFN